MHNQFPTAFAHLEHLADWALPTQPARYQKRVSEAQETLEQVHSELFDALPSILDYLDSKGDPATLDSQDARLLDLALMGSATGVAVERLGSPSIDSDMDITRLELVRA